MNLGSDPPRHRIAYSGDVWRPAALRCSALADTLKSVAYTGVPGGIVKIGSCEEETLKQPVKTQGVLLREVLNTIVAADPRYYWQHEDGVVNLLPTKGEPVLLKTPITQFRVKDAVSAELVVDKLLALSEVQKKMQELHLSHGLKLLVIPSSPKLSTFSVHCKNVTLREALNEIARAQVGQYGTISRYTAMEEMRLS